MDCDYKINTDIDIDYKYVQWLTFLILGGVFAVLFALSSMTNYQRAITFQVYANYKTVSLFVGRNSPGA
jgi:hypothetical protein